MIKITPINFFRQVKAEMQKVSWPSRKETLISTAAVFTMVFFAAMFLFMADQFMAFAVRFILDLGM